MVFSVNLFMPSEACVNLCLEVSVCYAQPKRTLKIWLDMMGGDYAPLKLSRDYITISPFLDHRPQWYWR